MNVSAKHLWTEMMTALYLDALNEKEQNSGDLKDLHLE